MLRLRLAEILEERGMTAYALVKTAGGRIDMSQAYRLVRCRGRVRYLDTKLLDTLCDVLDVEPGTLLERTRGEAKRSVPKRARPARSRTPKPPR